MTPGFSLESRRPDTSLSHMADTRSKRILIVDGTVFLQVLVDIGNRTAQRRLDGGELPGVRRPQSRPASGTTSGAGRGWRGHGFRHSTDRRRRRSRG